VKACRLCLLLITRSEMIIASPRPRPRSAKRLAKEEGALRGRSDMEKRDVVDRSGSSATMGARRAFVVKEESWCAATEQGPTPTALTLQAQTAARSASQTIDDARSAAGHEVGSSCDQSMKPTKAWLRPCMTAIHTPSDVDPADPRAGPGKRLSVCPLIPE